MFDRADGAWHAAPDLPRAGAGGRPAIAIGAHHYLFLDVPAGWELPGRALLLDARTLTWSAADFHTPEHSCVAPLGRGAVLVSGGVDSEGRALVDNALVHFEVS